MCLLEVMFHGRVMNNSQNTGFLIREPKGTPASDPFHLLILIRYVSRGGVPFDRLGTHLEAVLAPGDPPQAALSKFKKRVPDIRISGYPDIRISGYQDS